MTTLGQADIDAYCGRLREAGLDAPWSRPGPLIQAKGSRVQPFLWQWSEIEPRLQEAARFVAPGRGAERRILRLANPGVPERTSAHTLSVAVQYLLPGETAPSHRHTPNALRFMIQGEGAYTIVEGRKFVMAPGDLAITPSQTWHEHGNEGSEPVMWLDGLDSPVVRYLEILSMESPEGAGAAISHATGGRTIHYPFVHAHRELLRRAGSDPAASEVVMEYVDPNTGRSVLPTIDCCLRMLRPGAATETRGRTSCGVYHVVRGRGASTIGDFTCEWRAGDFFVVPPRTAHSHRNVADEPAVLFSLHDSPLLRALELYYEG
jgi:gentisate 1,2-dioxygenase